MKHSIFLAVIFGINTHANAALVQYSSESNFVNSIEANHYLEDFDSLTPGNNSISLNFSSNGYSYTASAPTNLWVNSVTGDQELSTNSAADSILIDFTGLAVTAIGGYFFSSDVNENPLISEIVLNFSDGSTIINLLADHTSFMGFTSDVTLSSMSITATDNTCGQAACWATIDDFYVGSASASVPEPLFISLMGVGLLGFGATRFTQSKS